MYCGNCDKEYKSTLNRCPDCKAWLKPSKRKSDGNHSGGNSDRQDPTRPITFSGSRPAPSSEDLSRPEERSQEMATEWVSDNNGNSWGDTPSSAAQWGSSSSQSGAGAWDTSAGSETQGWGSGPDNSQASEKAVGNPWELGSTQEQEQPAGIPGRDYTIAVESSGESGGFSSEYGNFGDPGYESQIPKSKSYQELNTDTTSDELLFEDEIEEPEEVELGGDDVFKVVDDKSEGSGVGGAIFAALLLLLVGAGLAYQFWPREPAVVGELTAIKAKYEKEVELATETLEGDDLPLIAVNLSNMVDLYQEFYQTKNAYLAESPEGLDDYPELELDQDQYYQYRVYLLETLADLQRYDEAKKLADELLQEKSQSKEVLTLKKEVDDALFQQELTVALELVSEADAMYKAGKYSTAISLARKAAQSMEADPRKYKQVAYCYYLAGLSAYNLQDKQTALGFFKDAVKYGQGNKDYQMAYEDLNAEIKGMYRRPESQTQRKRAPSLIEISAPASGGRARPTRSRSRARSSSSSGSANPAPKASGGSNDGSRVKVFNTSRPRKKRDKKKDNILDSFQN